MRSTLADLASKPSASFTFDCRPCRRHKFYHGEDLERFVARFPAEMTFEALRPRLFCPQCKMPVDGVFRTFTFGSATSAPGHGWSGPKG
jgi:hypothetical protein